MNNNGENFESAAVPSTPVKTRRVGTFTMGIALIITGFAIIISLFSSSFSIITVAKFAPVILIFMGIEILVQSFINKEEKLKYDFLSGIVCFILISVSLILSMVSLGIENFYIGPTRTVYSHELSPKYNDEFNSALENEEFSNIYTTVNDDVYEIHLTFSEEFENPSAFAKRCENVLDKLEATDINFDEANFFFNCENNDYQLYLDADSKFDMSSEELEQCVSQN